MSTISVGADYFSSVLERYRIQALWSQNCDTEILLRDQCAVLVRKKSRPYTHTLQCHAIVLDTTGTTYTFKHELKGRTRKRNNELKKKKDCRAPPNGDVADNTKQAKETIPLHVKTHRQVVQHILLPGLSMVHTQACMPHLAFIGGCRPSLW